MKDKLPFEQAVKQMMEVYGVSFDEAMVRVQNHYSEFKQRNDRLLERQNDAANAASQAFNNQVTLTATATLTFSGAFVGVVQSLLSSGQFWLFFAIVVCELIALTFAIVDYSRTVKFHNEWAQTYLTIDQRISADIESGKIQQLSELGDIEAEHYSTMKSKTNSIPPRLSATFAMLGAWLFLLLLSFFFVNTLGN